MAAAAAIAPSDRVAGRAERPADRPERDLVSALRAELAAIEPTRPCCREAERVGLGSRWPRRASPAVARLALRLARPGRNAERPEFDPRSAPAHCRIAYLRGLFLSRGSLSLARGRTHLEFLVDPEEAERLALLLAQLGLPATWRVRRGRGVVTWKGSETVVTFLRRAGASAAVLELEARVVTRTLRGHLNRVLNAEGANLQRSVATATRQLAVIDSLEGRGLLQELSPTLRAVALERREAPDATFTELAARLGMTRSLVQRAFERMETLALGGEREEGDGRPRGRRRGVAPQ